MDIDCIPYEDTGYFSELICDYLREDKSLRPFYHRFPHLGNFQEQIAEKAKNYPQSHRELLFEVLQKQYNGFTISKKTTTHIRQLKEPITFTVVTGHQLNLFTGPLYFLYKIITTIKLTQELKRKYPKYNFVPVYWMATEDHDFDEINFFNFQGKKIQWNPDEPNSGAVGHRPTAGLQQVFQAFGNKLGNSGHARTLKQFFEKAYLERSNLADATRNLANTLFGEYGLVIVDGDDRDLKRLLIPYAERDILNKTGFQNVGRTISQLQELPKKYGIQVNPREINYFYLAPGIRERLIEKEGRFYVNETAIEFSKDQLLAELKDYPERFSPNVVMRPLYQEVILPNLCYIGGGGELAYWLELKSMFDSMGVTFPILSLRNSALLLDQKDHGKLQGLNLSPRDLFLEQNSFINKKIREISNIEIDFSPQKNYLEEQFKGLYRLAGETDKSFLGAVRAQEAKQKKGLDRLEKRLLKAQKRKLADHVTRITEIQNKLFPNRSLQERSLNFSEFYLESGTDLIPNLMNALQPLDHKFTVLIY